MTNLVMKNIKSLLIRGTAKQDGDGTEKKKGLGVMGTSFLLVGEMAGTGVMALPRCMDQTGVIGGLLIIVLCLVCAFTGSILSRCWLLVQERYDEYKGHVRHPYPTIAFITFGKIGRTFLSFCANFSMFCACVIILMVASENISSLLFHICGVSVPSCWILIIVDAVMLPLSWLGTPKDFWGIGVVAAVASLIAVLLMATAICLDAIGPYRDVKVHHSRPELLPFFQAFGSMTYMTSGHYAFPTIQNDMQEPQAFPRAIALAYIGLGVLYLPIGLCGYYVYGNAVAGNVLLSLTPGALAYIVQIMVTIHTMAAMIININPLLQHAEEVVGLCHGVSWKQIVLRSIIFILVLVVALSVPSFGMVLSVGGGSVLVWLGFIIPCAFYIKLCYMKGPWPAITIPFHVKVIFIEIMCVSAVVSVLSTAGNVKTVLEADISTTPCIFNMTTGG